MALKLRLMLLIVAAFLSSCSSNSSDLAFIEIRPGAMSSSLEPTILGTTRSGDQVQLFSDSGCTNSISPKRKASVFADYGIAITAGLTPNGTNKIFAESVDSQGNRVDCAFLTDYIHDSTLPLVASITRSDSQRPFVGPGALPRFTLTFSEPINPSTFTSCDLKNTPYNSSIDWAIKDTGDHQHFTLTAQNASSMIQPTLKRKSVLDQSGNRLQNPTTTVSHYVFVSAGSSSDYLAVRKGDVNLDGLVNDTDSTLTQSNPKFGTGQSATWCDGDVDENGVVNAADLAVIELYKVNPAPPLLNILVRGDSNFDGVVDGLDATFFSEENLYQPATFCTGDFDLDGILGDSDISILQANTGAGAPKKELISGDVNLDGTVNGSDLTLAQNNSLLNTGQNATWCEGDVNEDGVLNSQDITLIQQQMSAGSPTILRTLFQGDINMDGNITIDDSDLISVQKFTSRSAANWCEGDSNNDGIINQTDVNYIFAMSPPVAPESSENIGTVTDCGEDKMGPSVETPATYKAPQYCEDLNNGEIQTRTRYKKMVVPLGTSCETGNQTRTCENGIFSDWQGDFKAPSCQVLPRSGSSLTKINLESIADAYEMTIPDYLADQFNKVKPPTFVPNDQLVFSNITGGIATWATNWLANIDLTGQNWTYGAGAEVSRGGTLITTRHVVHADHWKIDVGQTVGFYDSNGNSVERTIIAVNSVTTSTKGTPTDIAVGTLNSPVPDSIMVYPVLSEFDDGYEGMNEALYKTPYLMFNQQKKAYVNRVDTVSSDYSKALPNTAVPSFMTLNAIVGDSGKPDFIIVEGIPVLMSTHTQNGYGHGPYYGSLKNQQGIEAITNP